MLSGVFLIASISGGVGIRSPTCTTTGCCIFFLLIAFVCSHPTFECYIYIHVKCIIYNVNVLFLCIIHIHVVCVFNHSCQWWCGHSKSHLDHSWVLHIFGLLLLYAIIPHLSAIYTYMLNALFTMYFSVIDLFSLLNNTLMHFFFFVQSSAHTKFYFPVTI